MVETYYEHKTLMLKKSDSLVVANPELKLETEKLFLTTQDENLQTGSYDILMNRTDLKCRFCTNTEKIINHIISECSTPALSKFKYKHYKVDTCTARYASIISFSIEKNGMNTNHHQR